MQSLGIKQFDAFCQLRFTLIIQFSGSIRIQIHWNVALFVFDTWCNSLI